jgi:hypothetical protein
MFYHIAKHSFSLYNKGNIIAKFAENIANEFTSNGHVEIVESSDFQFPQAFFLEEVPEKYKKDEIIYDICPFVEDPSWIRVEAQPEILAQDAIPEILAVDEVLAVESKPEVLEVLAKDEFWSKDGEADLFVDPKDESYQYHAPVEAVAYEPAVEAVEYVAPVAYQAPVPAVQAQRAVVEHWVKDGQPAQYSLPMMLDPSYEVIPKIKAGYIVLENEIMKQIAAQNAINVEAKQYLDSTDWYIIRLMDNGVAVPEDIKVAREAARLRIK